eukprot:GEMP01046156.1.p1 GENE.GEMP01046156.1~~GEMP01046156.1.p1  ORF type:complete len:279 (+),score=58.77 GEMP01046156.1:39-839(+)
MWFLLLATSSASLGSIRLDNYTYDKFVNLPDIDVLVKFDKSYAYGDQEEEFKKLCKQAYAIPRFFIATVGIGEYGDKENDDLRERFNLRISDLPHLKLYKNREPIAFNGTLKDAAPVVLFLRQNGINISPIGSLAEYDSVVMQFVNTSASASLREELLTKSQEIAHTFKKKNNENISQEYVRVMEKVIAKGIDYIDTEYVRLGRLLNGAQMNEEQKEKMTTKMRVLSVFLAYRTAAVDDLSVSPAHKCTDSSGNVAQACTGKEDIQ